MAWDPPKWWIALVVVIIVLIITLVIYRRFRYRSDLPRARSLREHNAQVQRCQADLRKGARKRLAEERLNRRSTAVYFSRYVKAGRLRHWVLIINGTKYELRQNKATKDFELQVKPYERWTEKREQRVTALRKGEAPKIEGHYIGLIGWTALSDEELKTTCNSIMESFGTYRLLWNNCQDFLQRFAEKIISRQRRALDWTWFREHTKTEFQQADVPPPPPLRESRRLLQRNYQPVALGSLDPNTLQVGLMGLQQTALGGGAAGGGA